MCFRILIWISNRHFCLLPLFSTNDDSWKKPKLHVLFSTFTYMLPYIDDVRKNPQRTEMYWKIYSGKNSNVQKICLSTSHVHLSQGQLYYSGQKWAFLGWIRWGHFFKKQLWPNYRSHKVPQGIKWKLRILSFQWYPMSLCGSGGLDHKCSDSRSIKFSRSILFPQQ